MATFPQARAVSRNWLGAGSLALVAWIASACGGSSSTAGTGGSAATTGTLASTGTGGTGGGSAGPKVFIILMENHNWADIKGSTDAPYINSLLAKGAHSEQYFNPPKLHPSEPNYIWLEAGSNLGVLTDLPPVVNSVNTTDHLVTYLEKAGLTWKAYAENIDGAECPLQANGKYAERHVPMLFFEDVTDGNDLTSQNCIAHVRPYAELATDLAGNKSPNYNFLTPNLCSDMHDSCQPLSNPIAQGDAWLAAEVPKLLGSQAYADGATVIITWDEGQGQVDGPLGMIVLGNSAKVGFVGMTHFTHSDTLRTIQDIFGVQPYLGGADKATGLGELFTALPGK